MCLKFVWGSQNFRNFRENQSLARALFFLIVLSDRVRTRREGSRRGGYFARGGLSDEEGFARREGPDEEEKPDEKAKIPDEEGPTRSDGEEESA